MGPFKLPIYQFSNPNIWSSAHRGEESAGAKITSFSSLFMCREQASTIVLLKTPDDNHFMVFV